MAQHLASVDLLMAPPPLRGTSSFMDMDEPSPAPPPSLRTPHLPPDAAAQHQALVGSGQPGSSTAPGSELSGAPTDHAPRPPARWTDHDSPLHRKPPEMPAQTPRVPQCPQKQPGSSAHKPRGKEDAEDIRPRTLDLGDAQDPVNDLSLSPMNMTSSPQVHSGGIPTTAGVRRSLVRQPPEVAESRRPKRPRTLSGLSEVTPMMSMEHLGPPARAEPPPLIHRNSMADTKMLFARKDARSCSFIAAPGSEHAFKFDEHFVWEGRLGSGSFSEVYAVRHKMRPSARRPERYAIKRSKREFHSRKERAEYLKEVELANDMPAHPNVVEYYRAWQDSYFFYVQMELCENGTLGQLMTREYQTLRLPQAEPRVWEMVLHIARGLGHIHSYDVMHCDLKPDNILVSRDGAYKIGDLGQSTTLKAWDEQEGDACYLSRDLLEAKPSTAADIFSFGIMLFEIKSGEPLPGSGERWEVLRSGAVPPPAGCGAALAQIIHQMMSPQREARPTAQQILHACCNAQAQAAAEAAMAAALMAASGGAA